MPPRTPASQPRWGCLPSATRLHCCRAPTPPSPTLVPASWPLGGCRTAAEGGGRGSAAALQGTMTEACDTSTLHPYHTMALPRPHSPTSVAVPCIVQTGSMLGWPSRGRRRLAFSWVISPRCSCPPSVASACSTAAWRSSWLVCECTCSSNAGASATRQASFRADALLVFSWNGWGAAASWLRFACSLQRVSLSHEGLPGFPLASNRHVGVQAPEHIWCCCLHLL